MNNISLTKDKYLRYQRTSDLWRKVPTDKGWNLPLRKKFPGGSFRPVH